MTYYQLSPLVRIVSEPESKLFFVYHSLFGNPRIFNTEGIRFLEFFRQPADTEELKDICDADPNDLIRELSYICFLTEPGVNESKLVLDRRAQHLSKVRQGETIDRMGLAISDACNFGCAHCIHFQPSTNNGSVLPIYQQPATKLNMTWQTAKQCIDIYVDLIRKAGKRSAKIHFGNAEPLINWDVIATVLRYCTESFTELDFEYTINTNLVLMNREIAEQVKRYRVRIATSLDGVAKANDSIRVTKDGRGTFSKIVEKFDLLSEIGYPLDGFSITVTRDNFDLVETDVIDLAAERKMTSIAFDYDLIDLIHIPVALRVDKLMRLKHYANDHGIDFFGTWDSAFRNLCSDSLLTGTHAFCAAVQGKSLEFNVDGSVKVCGHTTTKVGHIDDFSHFFQEAGGFFQLIKERFPGTNEYCSGCAIEGPCGGQCHVTREVVARSIGDERQRLFADMCNFYRSVTNALALEYLRSDGNAILAECPSCTL